MKFNIFALGWFFAAILLAVILLMNKCSKQNLITPNSGELKITVDTVYLPGDTTTHAIAHDKPHASKIIPQDFNAIEFDRIKIDTLAILKDYYAKVFYQDTIRFDSILVFVNDTLTQNRILSRKVAYKRLAERTIIKTVTIEQPKTYKLLAGAFLSYDNKVGVGASVMFQNKKDNGFIYSYDLLNNRHQVGAVWKMKVGKK